MQRRGAEQPAEYTDRSRLIDNTRNKKSSNQPIEENEEKVKTSGRWWQEVRPYNVYVLLLLLLAYLLNQLDRYMLPVTVLPVAQEIKFGDKGCFRNASVHSNSSIKCNGTDHDSCLGIQDAERNKLCFWDYNGQGWDYLILAGPVFILIYTFAGIFIGFAADHYNRKMFLAFCLAFWSAMTLLTGFVKEYWQLVVLRFGLGLGEAGCTPFASSLITDYFNQSLRGTALGIYNFGVYFGYSLSFAVGNFITLANINGQSWRWAFIISGIPGIVLGAVIAFSVREPDRMNNKSAQQKQELEDSITTPQQHLALLSIQTRLKTVLKVFLRPSLLLLCLAGSIRNAAGYVLAYNSQLYFETTNVSKEMVGSYMSWIPLVGGSIGALGGGFISDRVVRKWGLYARVSVLVASQLLAAPFAAGVLFLNAPYAFFSLIPTYIIGEMWISVTLTVAVELVPSQVRTSAVAVYLFIITNIGGNLPLLVPPIAASFESRGYNQVDALRGALYILYPGLFVLGGLLFLLTMFVVKRDQQRAQYEVVTMEDP
ncbi:MFS-type efflux pump [Biomphalaria pfeifferi]|uniref:MFS-type efflux pump n=1 Tax=Biomphalaria pfeifferi TaxID=112525 RepID=A0AAD8FJ66_BIOPF|nr:MFS-type efflux pump [Biomphalaria pfeifferi]